jgi:hypothetical protein
MGNFENGTMNALRTWFGVTSSQFLEVVCICDTVPFFFKWNTDPYFRFNLNNDPFYVECAVAVREASLRVAAMRGYRATVNSNVALGRAAHLLVPTVQCAWHPSAVLGTNNVTKAASPFLIARNNSIYSNNLQFNWWRWKHRTIQGKLSKENPMFIKFLFFILI